MNLLNELKQKCIKDKIPIVRDNTLNMINHLIDNHCYKSILELGTAYGYSAYCLSLNKLINTVISIEKDKNKYAIASGFLNKFKNIKLVNDDIFDFIPNKNFDLIFVDGPKSHQQDIVNKYYEYLNKGGTMVIDNIFLRKFNSLDNLTKKQEKLINKVNDFRKWLHESKLNVKILDIDDGIAIISKPN